MKICLGTAQIGQTYGVTNTTSFPMSEVQGYFDMAYNDNIHYIDTASSYNSEKILGQINLNKNFKIISKILLFNDFDDYKNSIDTQINNILNNLNLNHIYGILIHDAFLFSPIDLQKILDYLYEKKKQGLFNKVGISIYEPNNYDDLAKVEGLEIIQFPLNILDQRFLNLGLIEDMKNNNIETHVRSIFLQGTLLDIKKPYINNEYKFINNFSIENKITLLELCLDFIDNIKNIDLVILGFNSINQYKKSINVLKNKLNVTIDYSKFSTNNINLIDPRKW